MPRRRSSYKFSAPVFGAALSVVLCFQAAGADRNIALTEIRLDDLPPRSKCGLRAGKEQGECAPKMSASARLARPLFAVVSLADQSISIYNHEGLVTQSQVSTGMAGHSTPKGIFTIIGRERFHASNIYSGAPMPFMQRLTWSGVAMHLGVVPDHPASHGCVRLPAEFAAKLWGMTRIGERVVIAPHDVTPTEIAHPLLPSPNMQLVVEAGRTPAPIPPGTTAPLAEPQRLNPHQLAERLKARATVDRIGATKAAAAAYLFADTKETEAQRLPEDLKTAETASASAQAKAEAAVKAFHDAEAAANAMLQDAALTKAKDVAAAAKTKAEEERAAAALKLDAVKKAEAASTQEVNEAYRRWQAAAKAVEAAENAEKDAELRTAPVSVLISKADKRVYVRQGLAPVFDAPASVRDPKSPLGSHLYIATAAGEDGASLKWLVVSVPAQSVQERGERKKSQADEEIFHPLTYSAMSSTPEEALERIEITQDVRDRIAERLWTGASIIIADQTLSGETGNVGTDLVVKLR